MGSSVCIKSDTASSLLRKMSHTSYVEEMLKEFSYDDHIFLVLVGKETFITKLPEYVFPIKHIPLNISVWYEMNFYTYVVCIDTNILISFTTFLDMMEYLECL